MFDKKGDKKNQDTDNESGLDEIKLTVMPEIFYGGKDPEIYHTQTPKEEIKKEVKPNEEVKNREQKKQEQKKSLPVVAKRQVNKKSFFTTKRLIIGGSILMLVAIALISWYYISQAFPAETTPTVLPTDSTTETPTIIETTTTTTTTTEDLVEVAPTTTPSLSAGLLSYPRVVLVDSVDLDADSLTDLEEELFDTDSGTWDTDTDGYYDGQEIVNLYSPKGSAPMVLVDSGLIREYINPTWQYRVYYPQGWESASVDARSDQVLFSAITGDYIEVVAVPKLAGESFQNWFVRNAKGQRYTDLSAFTNRFQVEGYKRQDSLVAYFESDSVVYVMLYQPGATGTIPFRHVMIMMFQSFRPTATTVELPEQVVLPGKESGVVTSTIEESVTTTEPEFEF
ncbi:hypothetical protein KJ641_00630 [Patescibacteria group bacterium]|nr:hypothetical protein [Patescibacteria group bacterium]